MKTSKNKINRQKVENPFLFLVVLFLLLISVSVVIIGLFKRSGESQEQNQKDMVVNREDASLNQYFEKEFSESSGLESESEFEKNDPFKQICSGTTGDDQPSISGNTVCLR